MNSVAVGDAVSTSTAQRTKPAIYLWLAALMIAIVVSGFWNSFFGPAFRGSFPNPLVIEIHALVFMGWLALFVAQAVLAWKGRLAAHRQVGRWGIAYGFIVIAMGIVAGIAASVLAVRTGRFPRDEAARFLIVPFVDVVLFGVFFLAAVANRRTPEIHKRLMIVATNALIGPAVTRFAFFQSGTIAGLLLGSLIGFSPILVGMVSDWRVRGRPHAVYVVGLVTLFLGGLRVAIAASDAWLRIGRAILAAFV